MSQIHEQCSEREEDPLILKLTRLPKETPACLAKWHLDRQSAMLIQENLSVLYNPNQGWAQNGLANKKVEMLNPLALGLAYYIIEPAPDTSKGLASYVNKERLNEVRRALFGNDDPRFWDECTSDKCKSPIISTCTETPKGKFCRYGKLSMAALPRYLKLWAHILEQKRSHL